MSFMSFIDEVFTEIAYIAASGMAKVRISDQNENGGKSDGFIIIITPIANPFNSPAFADAMKGATLFANDNRFELIPPDNDHHLDRTQVVEKLLRETYKQRRARKERPWRHATKTNRSRRDTAMEAYRANHTYFPAVSNKQGPRPRSSRNPRIRT